MRTAALMAVRVQAALDEIAARKATPDEQLETERRLVSRLEELFGPVLDRVDRAAAGGRLPSDEVAARATLGDLAVLSEELLEVLIDELAGDVADVVADVEAKVAAAHAAAAKRRAPGVDQLRPYGLDRRIFQTLIRSRDRMLGAWTIQAVDALVGASELDMFADELRNELTSRLQGRLQEMTRWTIGELHNEAVEQTERDLGVTYHRWTTAGDERVRPAHEMVDGEVARVGRRFSNGWRRPGGLGCRCAIEPWFPPDGMRPPAGADHFHEDDLEPAA